MNVNKTDVLVVGAGPAGLFTALFLARAGIHDVTVLDRHALATQIGHASGIHPRTLEILHTLNLHNELISGSGGVAETAFWTRTQREQDLKRSSVAPEVTTQTFYRRTIIQHQGRTESILNEELAKRGIKVHRPNELLEYEYINEGPAGYQICAFVKDHTSGQVKKWHCKYLVGADGAKSDVRQLAGIGNTVNETEATWAVADVDCETDFPDLRRRCPIRTPHGNLMLIPSPNKTLRIYMLLSKHDQLELDDSRFDKPTHTSNDHHETLNRTTLLDLFERNLPSILFPYKLNIKQVLWISRYTVAQRVTNRFFDGKNLVLVGDACHTNSPKAGQGMNTGVHDAYNLGWKLALVLRDRAHSSLLETYNFERRHIALQLIDFDKQFATLFADQSQIALPEFRETWAEHRGFASGLSHQYPPSSIVEPLESSSFEQRSNVSEPLSPGKRFLPMRLIRHIDGWEVTSLDVMPCNGEFHLVIFAGDVATDSGKIAFDALYDKLTAPDSALTTYNGLPHESSRTEARADPRGPESKTWPWEDIHTNYGHAVPSNKIVNVFVVHTSDHFLVELRPRYEEWMYKFFEDRNGLEHERHGMRADQTNPSVVLVRPDGVVARLFSSPTKVDKELQEYLQRAGINPLAKVSRPNGFVD
ncbi:FAD binding domain-containing [Lecanosticta acicola]|uniref:FAD binding domain-containing n=1 Tax=Lecanosticta acicola TaxID=111012 RepID=A0AAI9EAT2_9PEZI|nr:FAD binding domain-containing [Lecanosticta acicola]